MEEHGDQGVDQGEHGRSNVIVINSYILFLVTLTIHIVDETIHTAHILTYKSGKLL